jgi:hypothetical protein
MTEWQPITWNVFHNFALHYNENYRNQYIIFFNTFKILIPCKICKTHYIQNLNKENLSLEKNMNKERIFDWTVDLHNIVNKLNYKRQWSYIEARKHYDTNHFNNNILKKFILEFVKNSFRKNPIKTQNLIKMMKTISYLHPNETIKQKLIDFSKKFELNRFTLKQWMLTFIIIIDNVK